MSFGLSGIIPGLHWVLTQEELDLKASLKYSCGCLILMGVLYITGALLYALRIPERFFPGKCDVWFHSHQLFHILVIAAAVVHYQGISEMAMYRLTSSDAVCAVSHPRCRPLHQLHLCFRSFNPQIITYRGAIIAPQSYT